MEALAQEGGILAGLDPCGRSPEGLSGPPLATPDGGFLSRWGTLTHPTLGTRGRDRDQNDVFFLIIGIYSLSGVWMHTFTEQDLLKSFKAQHDS